MSRTNAALVINPLVQQNVAFIFKITQKGVEREVFRITPDKTVIVAKGYDVDDAARAFWRSVKGLASGEWTVEGVSDDVRRT